jgi:hypothetical protein
MIVRINGVRIDECQEDLMQPKSINVAHSRIKKFLPLGHKVVFGVAMATIFIDMLMGSGGFMSAGVGKALAATADIHQISNAFDPVKQLLIDVADPLCYVMFVWGCIECIVGRAASGLNRMKYAAIGYIAINWIPVVMAVIRGAAPH